MLTCYSPVRRSSTPKGLSARLACVRHAASVRPEPGSNSPLNVYSAATRVARGLLTHRSASSARPPSSAELVWEHDRLRRRPVKAILANPSRNHEPSRPSLAWTGLVHVALAFSTLLSSQETDAHLRKIHIFLGGNPSNLPGRWTPVNEIRKNFADERTYLHTHTTAKQTDVRTSLAAVRCVVPGDRPPVASRALPGQVEH